MMQLVTLGEILIDMFPTEFGHKLENVPAFAPKPGGAPANVAVAARRLGMDVAFIGKVGDDAFGYHLKDTLDAEGVDVRGMCIDAEARTTMALIAMPDANHAEFIFYRNPGADTRLTRDELPIDLLKATHALHFGSLSLTDDPARAATRAAIEIVRQAGGFLSYDVNYRPALWHSPQAALQAAHEMLPLVNLLKVNETELALLSEREVTLDEASLSAAAQVLRAEGPDLVVVTLGKDGSFFQTKDASGFVKAFQVETIDAVGCGDAFIAGFLSKLIVDGDWHSRLSPEILHQNLRYANAVGALTSLKRGVIPALPSAAEVQTFLESFN